MISRRGAEFKGRTTGRKAGSAAAVALDGGWCRDPWLRLAPCPLGVDGAMAPQAGLPPAVREPPEPVQGPMPQGLAPSVWVREGSASVEPMNGPRNYRCLT